MRPRPSRGHALALLLATACADSTSPADLTWRARFSPEDLGGRAVRVHASISRGSCADSSEVLYAEEIDAPSSMLPAPPALGAGTYAFRVSARDAVCAELAEGCTTIELPGPDSVTVVLTAAPGEPDCDDCVDGRCGGDAGRPDASRDSSLADGDASDADVRDGDSDASTRDAEGGMDAAADAMDGGDGAVDGTISDATDAYVPPPEPACPMVVGPFPSCTDEAWKRIFVTSDNYHADFLGTSAADAECQRLANAAGVPGVYVAWLSDDDTDAIDRIPEDGTYCTVTGELVFRSVRGSPPSLETVPARAIDVDELGDTRSEGVVWTGTQRGGHRTLQTCINWTWSSSSDPRATTGTMEDPDGICGWTSVGTTSCGTRARFYCLER